MGRTVKVCGTPTAIPLDVDQDESGFGRGGVLQTTHNGLVLMGTDGSLRVVDARRFCAGFVDVRHTVELPSGATFIRRKSSVGTGIAWKNTLGDDGEWSGAIYIVDFQTGEVAVRTLPRLDEMAADIFVDEKGEQVAVVGATSGRLYGWSLNDRDCNDRSDARGESKWRIVSALAKDAASVGARSCWRFVSSAVMGNCGVYLRASPNTSGSVIIEKWIFDVEANWLPVTYSSRTFEVSDADSTEGLALFFSEKWKFVILTIGKVFYHFQIDQDLTDCPVKRLVLDHQVLDGAWVDQDAAFAILFMNGQISIASVSDVGCFELLGIETSDTMSKRLSLSALLGKAVPAALQLVWVAQEQQIVVDFGATLSAFKLEVVNEESSTSVGGEFEESIELCASGAFPLFNRRIRGCTNCDDCIHELLERKSPPCSNDFLDISKFALIRSQETFEDSYFMILSKVHQQLADDFAKTTSCHDPIDWVGKSLKLMEVLVSFTVSVGGASLRQISSKILSVLPGCTTLSDRKLYYRKEIEAISSQVRKLTSGIGGDEDWWVGSMEVTAFLRVYFTTVHSLLQDIQSGANVKPEEASQILSLCQWVIEHQDRLDALARDERHDDPSVERLKGLLISYTIICCYLRVNGVIIDLEHLFSLLPHIDSSREEFFCCFLKPWQISGDTPATNNGLSQAVTFATKSDAMQLLVNFCLASRSLEVHSCVQALCSAAATTTIPDSDKISQDRNLHWQVCETYIGEAMAILHRIGARRTFKYPNREAERISGCLSVAIDTELTAFLRSLSAEVARTSTKCHGSTNNCSLWEFSRLDNWLRDRVLCLISRILWHLETGSEDVGGLFQHAFAMIDAQLTLSSENQLYDCLTKAQLIVNPIEGELRLPRFRQAEDSSVEFCCRSQTIARSLVLVTWGLWLREKSAYCSRGIRIGSMENVTTKTETIGALAATCALSLDALGMIYGENEELLNIQLSLLEDAAIINPSKTAAVIAWGYPTQKILTRYLKRYKVLRLTLQRSSVDVSIEDKELQLQQLQARVRKVFHRFLVNFGNGEPTEIKPSDIDVLAACCCDRVGLQIMSALAKCPCEVVSTGNPVAEKTLSETSSPTLELPENSRNKGAFILPSTTGNKVPCLPIPQVPDTLISRDEVIALLQAQTRHLEEKMQAVTTSGRSCLHEDTQNVQADELPVSIQGKMGDDVNETAVKLADSQRMARISLQVRDLRRHRYSSASSEAEIQSNPLDKPMQRHDSVRNALKLFRLRQENCVQPPIVKMAVAIENGELNVDNVDNSALDVKTSLSTRTPAAESTQRDKLKPARVKRKSSRNQHCSENRGYSSKEPVYPLRLEYGVDNASLKLLGRNSQQYNPSVKRRQFVHQQSEQSQKAYARTSNVDVKLAEVVQLKTASAQTNDVNDSIEPVLSVSAPVKEVEDLLGSEQDTLEPEKGSPVMQECDDANPVSKSTSQKGVGVQCQMTENGFTKEARKRGPPSLKIADKFPIWVGLGSADNIGTRSHFKERKKFLQVARFEASDTMQHLTNNDATEGSPLITISPKTIVHGEAKSEDGSEENQSDTQHSPSASNSQAQDDLAKVNVMKAMYRSRYREQYPVQERLNSRRREDQDGGSGINSLIDLRDDMQRMTQRLRELETCANSIDEEFKVSQKRLGRIGDTRVGDASQSRLLQDIDEVLEMTEEDRQGERKTTRGLLSKNASSNLNAAKYVFKLQR